MSATHLLRRIDEERKKKIMDSGPRQSSSVKEKMSQRTEKSSVSREL
jgi:hypothetical protein